MSTDPLEKHRRAFEACFFPDEADPLRRELFDTEQAIRFSELLGDAAGADQHEILQRLDSLGMGTHILAALSLFPLVSVAWADGRVDAPERQVVLDSAHAAGIERGEIGHRMLESWLEQEPDGRLLEVWKAYAKAVADSIGSEWRRALEDHIFALCERVAEATGDFLAIDKISKREYERLRELRDALR